MWFNKNKKWREVKIILKLGFKEYFLVIEFFGWFIIRKVGLYYVIVEMDKKVLEIGVFKDWVVIMKFFYVFLKVY